MKKIKIGVAITRRDMFPSPQKAKKNIDNIHEKVREIGKDYPEVEFLFADSVVENGVMVELEEEAKVEKLFRDAEIDGLFLPHANFGQEETAALLAYRLQVPVLVWGPRDGSPVPGEPFRDTDTQCGLFATTRALLRFSVPFTYAEHWWIDLALFREKLDHFIRVVSVVKTVRHLRVLQIGARPRQFLSVKINEGELMEKFGIQVIPVNDGRYVQVINRFLEEDSQELKDQVARMKQRPAKCRKKMCAKWRLFIWRFVRLRMNLNVKPSLQSVGKYIEQIIKLLLALYLLAFLRTGFLYVAKMISTARSLRSLHRRLDYTAILPS